ncbi:MAG: hypothetical protein ABIA37_02455 [Candidatus Woesearchaeota archaeon]
MEFVQEIVDRIVLKKKNSRDIPLKQTLIVAKSGHGKTLALERGIYSYWRNGFTVICINDVKNLLELGFIGMPPEIMASYQRKGLVKQGIEAVKADIKVFHPFSFDIPNTKIPEMRLYTLPVNALGDSEIRFLIEDTEDKTTRELIGSALTSMKPDKTLWDLLLDVEKMIERRTEKAGSQETKMPDPKLFGLSGTSTGSVKNIDELARIFNRFQTHMFLMPGLFDLNLDFKKELFDSQDTIKIFTTRYIKDQKTKDFVTLMLLNQIVEHAHKSKYPILIILDEIKDIVPSSYSRIGYKAVLAREITHHLNTSFRANNIASISTSQSFSGINKSLLRSNAFTETFIGSIDGETDILNLKQIFMYDRGLIETIQELQFNHFIVRGIHQLPVAFQEGFPFKCLFSPWPHKEPYYKYDQLFEKYYPEEMNKYSELVLRMKAIKKDCIKNAMESKMQKIKVLKEKDDQQKKEKEEVTKLKQKLQTLESDKRQSHAQQIQERNKHIWDKRNEMTQAELAKKFNISQPMINEILKRMRQEHG